MKMDCSVIICTWNRASQLSEVLESLARMNIPAGTTWEVIIVDNGSTDTTAQVVSSFENILPIKRIFQPNPGLSNARNSGIDAASGKYILWTDDDVHATPNWLASYLAVFKQFPEAAVFGGKITPVLVPPTPEWFQSALGDLGGMLGRRDCASGNPSPITGSELPFGANYAVRTNEQRKYRYDPELGVAPGRRRGGEEIAVMNAVLEETRAGWWVPDAEIMHIIPTSRQTMEYISCYYEAAGETWAYFVKHHFIKPEGHKALFGVPVFIWLKSPVYCVCYYVACALKLKWKVQSATRWAWYRGALKYFLSM
jgi:glucosyl-dolichyl phosphate glucuronosyltransferase